jgi:hypothetical protein
MGGGGVAQGTKVFTPSFFLEETFYHLLLLGFFNQPYLFQKHMLVFSLNPKQ